MDPPPEERFFRNILGLIDLVGELIGICHSKGLTNVNPSLVHIVKGFLEDMKRDKLIGDFIDKSYDHWEKIIEKDEIYFIEHCPEIFGGLPGEHVEGIRILFVSKDEEEKPIIIKEDKDAIWKFMLSLIKVCIDYVHRRRCPKIRQIEGKNTKIYTKNAFPGIKKLQYFAKLVGKKLVW